MINTIIVTGITFMIIILSWYVVYDTEVYRTAVSTVKGGVKKVPVKGDKRSAVRIANGPVVWIKEPGEYKYSSMDLEKDVVKIGRSAKNDIVLDDEAVEKVHAKIVKKMKGNDIYYEFINLSKCNPAEILNKVSSDYVYLGYKRGKMLGDCEAFYVGNTRLIIKRPVKHHQLTKTDRIVIGENDNDFIRETDHEECTEPAKKTRHFENPGKTREVDNRERRDATIRVPSGSKTFDV